MKKWIIGVLIALAAIAIGVGSAFAVNQVSNKKSNSSQQSSLQSESRSANPDQQNAPDGNGQVGPNGGQNRPNGGTGGRSNGNDRNRPGRGNNGSQMQWNCQNPSFDGKQNQFGAPSQNNNQGQPSGSNQAQPGSQTQNNNQNQPSGSNQTQPGSQTQNNNQGQSSGSNQTQPASPTQNGNQNQQQSQSTPSATPQFQGGMGMMNGLANQSQKTSSGTQLTLDQAVTNVQTYIQQQSATLTVSKVIEFKNDFYAVVSESDTGRGAMELIVNATTGTVSSEIGSNTMWNLKYSPMQMVLATTSTNTLTLDEARTKAEAALKSQGLNGTLNEGGYNFYGYYTFEYSIGGKTAGLVSVNGQDGETVFQTWHGQFVSEKELAK